MALRVQDAAGSETAADSYVDASDYASWLKRWGRTDGNEETVEVALRKAWRHLEHRHRHSFRGDRLTTTQNTSYPRKEYVDRDKRTVAAGTFPVELKDSQMEYAYRYRHGLDLDADVQKGMEITAETLSTDMHSKTTHYSGGGRVLEDGKPQIDVVVVDDIIAPHLKLRTVGQTLLRV